MPIVIPALWAVCVAGLAWYLGKAASTITYVTLADGRLRERQLPIIFRLLFPFTQNVTPFFASEKFGPAKKKVERNLLNAGYDGVISTEEFLALRVLVPLLVGSALVIGGHFSLLSVSRSFGDWVMALEPLIGGFLALWAIVYPGAWLKQAIAARHKSIQRALPFVLDLLTLSVEAGLDFMTGIQRILDRRHVDAISEELMRVLREVQLGRTRREALRNLTVRVDQRDIKTVVNALVQADELGASIGSILRIQADQTRARRFERAEKLGNEAPVKLLFPLTAFIFPAILIVLFGPVMLQMLRSGF